MEKKVGLMRRDINLLVTILVSAMPFHIFVFNLLDNKDLALWRDILILLCFAFILISQKWKIKVDKISKFIFISFLVCGIHALLFHSEGVSTGIWLNVLRVYLFPSLIYIVLMNANMDEKQKEKLLRIYIYEAIFVAIFGVFQQLVIGKVFTDFMGYRRESISFAYGLQRNIGLFDSANIMAMYMAFSLFILDACKSITKRMKLIFKLILLISLLLTFSMSGFLSFGIALFFSTAIKGNDFGIKILRLLKIASYVLLLSIFVLTVDSLFFSGFVFKIIGSRIDDITMALNADNLYQIQNSSAAAHFRSLIYPLDILRQNPFGIGFGGNTFMALGKVLKPQYLVESSVYTVFFDFGIFAGVLYFLPLVTALLEKNENCNNLSISTKSALLVLIVMFVFLPLIQSYELRFFIYEFIGLSKDRKNNYMIRG